MQVQEKHMLVMTDARDNHNKFWEGTLDSQGNVHCRWGRVGATGQSKVFHGAGLSYLRSKMREKEAKGYREVKTMDANVTSSTVLSAEVTKTVAKKQIEFKDPVVEKLIERLAEENRHQIVAVSGGRINVNAQGIVTTEVGVIDARAIREARGNLAQMQPFVQRHDFDNHSFIRYLNDYLMLVPQKVGSSRGWHHDFLPNEAAVIKQSSFLDQLESSIQLATSIKPDDPDIPEEKVFDVRLAPVTDKAVIAEINKLYKDSANARHVSHRLRPLNYYEVQIGAMHKAFEKHGAKMTNIWRLWHGTRTYNLLSILKQGLIIPKSGGSYNITGRMFGDGLYFSDQSTKSLNYSYGYWDGAGYQANCFMFLADVAMGNFHTPGSYGGRTMPRGYDSIFAKAGVSGVQNNEMIVPKTSQADLKYLIEFGQ